MVDKIWSDIFHWREFTNYLSKNELIVLSMGCKKLRFKLTSIIFKILEFRTFTLKGNYKNLVLKEGEDGYDLLLDEFRNRFGLYEYGNYEDLDFNMTINPYKAFDGEFTNSKTKFQSDLKLYYRQPKALKLTFVDDYFYLIHDFPNVYSNLNTLIIQHSIILIENFQYLLDNLNCLENLELTRTNLFKRKQNTFKNSINWPFSLKKLAICSNCYDDIDENEEAVILETYHFIDLEFKGLELQPKHLPKLLDLNFEPSSDTNSDNELWEFLKANPHIIKLKVCPSRYTPEFLNIIGAFHNLSYLNLLSDNFTSTSNDYVKSFEMGNSPILYRLKHLKLSVYKDPIELNNIAKHFPNVTDLTIQSTFMDLNHLCNSIAKFSKLKNLRLLTYPRLLKSKEFNFTNFNNLESIEFVVDHYDQYELFKWNINSCPKLRLVTFIKYNYYVKFDRPNLSPELASNWKLIYFPEKISFYKIK